jgi:thymidine phosphorylase
MSSAVDLIIRKRDYQRLSDSEIAQLVRGYVNGDVAHEQMAAFLMAVQLNGLDDQETLALTRAYVESGIRLSYPDVSVPTVDKHSTGGVGDKITLVLTPMMMALGCAVPQLSGRGLGHTGGTLDKLEAIDGFTSTLTGEQMQRQMTAISGFICAASDELAPADRLIYALRDVTGTVPSIPLIAASIMSKKIAEGTDALVLDVKVGRGAFMQTLADAETLGRTMIAIGTGFGVTTRVVLSAMDQPLGRSAGNAVEVAESIDVLSGHGPEDIRRLSVALAVEMLEAAGLSTADVETVLDDGRALQKFRDLVTAQGGNPDLTLPQPAATRTITADRDGYLTDLDALKVAHAAWHLGAGRARKEDPVDPAAGVIWFHQIGEQVRHGDPLFALHTSDDTRLGVGVAHLEGATTISDHPVEPSPLILGVLR